MAMTEAVTQRMAKTTDQVISAVREPAGGLTGGITKPPKRLRWASAKQAATRRRTHERGGRSRASRPMGEKHFGPISEPTHRLPPKQRPWPGQEGRRQWSSGADRCAA